MWLKRKIKSNVEDLSSSIKSIVFEKVIFGVNKTLGLFDSIILNAFVIRSAYESSKYFSVGDFYTVSSTTWCNVYDSDYGEFPKLRHRVPTGDKFLVLGVQRKKTNSIALEVLYKNTKGVIFLEGVPAISPWNFYKKL